MAIQIDRTPIYSVWCHNGDFGDNAYGLLPAFYDDPEAYITEQLEKAAEFGFSRVMLHMPQGHVDGQTYFTSASWYAMPPAVLSFFQDTLPSLVRPGGLRLFPFMGYQIPGDRDPTSRVMSDLAYPDHDQPADRAWMMQNLLPWAAVVGAREVCYDASADDAGNMSLWQAHHQAHGINVIGEAVPATESGGIYTPDPVHIIRCAWLALMKFVIGGGGVTARDPTLVWEFDPAATEVHALPEYDDTPTDEQLETMFENGWIVGGSAGVSDAMLRKIMLLNRRYS
jgi:hypothetical protein